jgi:hypothetical protein
VHSLLVTRSASEEVKLLEATKVVSDLSRICPRRIVLSAVFEGLTNAAEFEDNSRSPMTSSSGIVERHES